MSRADIGVAVVGFGWMGRVHSQAYLRLPHHYPNLPRPRLVAVADSEPDRRAEAVDRFRFERAVEDWREVLVDPAVQAVSVTAPNALHREVGAAVAAAGKHLWIEKPVGLSADDARTVSRAVHGAGVQSCVGFNYRNAPAVERARRMIAEGSLGVLTHARFRLFSDYAAHPLGVLSWRFERALGGPGVLGDLVSHGVDLVRYLLGDLERLVADTAVFIPRRPRAGGTTSHYAIGGSGDLADVENEDYLGCMIRTRSGARVMLESSRVAVGEQCNYGFEVHGTKGILRWDFRRMGELEQSSGENYADQFVTTAFATPADGALAAFQPGAGLAMGYDDLKVVEGAAFIGSIAEGRPLGATIDDAVASALALEAMQDSARTGSWVDVAT